MEGGVAKFGDLVKSRIVYHPENCVGCHLCAMACSLRYEHVVNPLKARIRIIRSDNITKRIIPTSECTRCGHCVTVCYYDALELSPIIRK
jgi:carbon-monoxide dehydrogenase iron sulfur subunit